MALPRSHPNVLAGPYLARVAHWRKDEERLRAALEDPATLFVPVWHARSAVVTSSDGRASAYFANGTQALAGLDTSGFILLGEFHERVVFAVAVAGEAPPALASGAELHDLRLIAGELSVEEAALLAYARAMVHWREHNRYCGRCSLPMNAVQGGHVMQCSNPTCAHQQFPRLDPAVIVLVTDGERALLGRQAAWPPGRYSTVAGFVEPGESLEDAVAREVREETGVIVDEVEYHSSQPWPFPSSLMLGFTARARLTDIDLSDEELEDARWFTRAQLAAGEIALPTTHSISFRLIEDWYDSGAERPLRAEPGVKMWQAPRR
ncbi:MAG TPA: NAD(+) diphosphatase [Steroidobacteraceae bacterium]|jgi:NAD+ diphosphatase|nr:NAD(+) diphosphatase [Steroidobacteraceae bacterium]